MTQCEYRVQESTVHVFGEKSKAANWIVSNVFLVMGGIALFLCLFTIPAGPVILWRVVTICPLFFVLALVVRLLFRDRCYRVELDSATEKIRFFKFYNKEIVEAPVRSVEFRGDRTQLVCLYAGKRFTIFLEYMDHIAELFPEGVEIGFADGFRGRLAKRQSEKRRRAIREAGRKPVGNKRDNPGQ